VLDQVLAHVVEGLAGSLDPLQLGIAAEVTPSAEEMRC
jgi:hypothetical protein